MKLILLLVLIYTVATSIVKDEEQWEKFKVKYDKHYKSLEEEDKRFKIFQDNLRKIEEHNKRFDAGNTTYTEGVNQFADMTHEEILKFLNNGTHPNPQPMTSPIYNELDRVSVPESMDWREIGAVSPVHAQGANCGSGWAFAATGVLESHYYLKYHRMFFMSQQQLIDCDPHSSGCYGGTAAMGLLYIQKNGIESDATYPYLGDQYTCHYNPHNAIPLKINEVFQLPPNDERSLLLAVGSLGPISVALDATDLYYYTGGVYHSNRCSTSVRNHEALIVGYGYDQASGLDYWLVKNSWGEAFGENGYFRIQRGTNECGIANLNVFPKLG